MTHAGGKGARRSLLVLPLLWLLPLLIAAPRVARADDAVTVAVAYFDNTAAAPELDVLRKGIADMLISDLAQLDGVRLVEREKLEALLKEIQLGKGPFVDPKTAQKMGKGLGAALLVTGSFLSLAPSLRVDARVVSVETGEVLATAAAEGPQAEFFKVQSELALKLAEALGAKVTVLGKARLLKPRTRSLEAMVAWSRGLDAEDRGDAKAARESFGKALAADPEFARAQERLAALEKRVAEVEQRTTALETSGGYILKPQTPADWFSNAGTASHKGDGKRQLEFFLGGWKAAMAPGVKLPLTLLLRTVAGFSFGAAGDEEAREVLGALEKAARDEAQPADRRALCALILGGEAMTALLEGLAKKDGFAAWALGLARDGALRAESNPASLAGAPAGAAARQGVAQRRLLVAMTVPLLPFLESCGASKATVGLCLVPASSWPVAGAVLGWIALVRAHGPAMRAFADGRAPSSFDDASTASLRRYLGASIDLLEFAAARAAEHPLDRAAFGPAPDDKSGRAWIDALLGAAASRPAGATESGEARPASLLAQAPCRGLGAAGWSRVREVEVLSDEEMGDEPAKEPLAWSPRRLCTAVDAALRVEVSRRLLQSRLWTGLAEEGPRADGLSWLLVDALELSMWPMRTGLDLLAQMPSLKQGCSRVIATLSEVAAGRAGSPPLERVANFTSRHERECGLFPDHEAADALRDCQQDRVPSCLRLAALQGKALGAAPPESRERGFWGAAAKLLRERCQRDRPFCSELGQAWIETSEQNVAADPRRTAGVEVLRGACEAGSLEACVMLAVHHADGRRLAPAQEAASGWLRKAIDQGRRDCDGKRPCPTTLDAAKRCAGGDLDQCELLLWAQVHASGMRTGEVRELRAMEPRTQHELAAWCKREDASACSLAADPFVPFAVPMGYRRPVATAVLDDLERELFAPLVRRCEQGHPRACAIESDLQVLRAGRFADRAGDRDAEAAARTIATERYRRALAAWDKACRDPDSSECPRWIALERRCGGPEAPERGAACEQLAEELGQDHSFLRSAGGCRDPDARRCRVDTFLFMIREESQAVAQRLASSCKSSPHPSPEQVLRCQLSRHIATSALPHVPEAAREVTARACRLLAPGCAAAPPGGPRPAHYCTTASYKELCRP